MPGALLDFQKTQPINQNLKKKQRPIREQVYNVVMMAFLLAISFVFVACSLAFIGVRFHFRQISHYCDYVACVANENQA